MEIYQQTEFFIACMNCYREIHCGDRYYKVGDYMFCPDCLENVAGLLLHCKTYTLGEEEP